MPVQPQPSASAPRDRAATLDHRPPSSVERALHAFAMHEAARERHVALLARARETIEESRELRAARQRLRDHTAAALHEMQELRMAVREYAHALRQSLVPPQRALALMKGDVRDLIGSLSDAESLADSDALATQLVRWMTDAYYEAA